MKTIFTLFSQYGSGLYGNGPYGVEQVDSGLPGLLPGTGGEWVLFASMAFSLSAAVIGYKLMKKHEQLRTGT